MESCNAIHSHVDIHTSLTKSCFYPLKLLSWQCFLTPPMQDKNNNSQPLGICHRLFNFFINSLISSGLKRVTLGHPVPQDSTAPHQSQVKPKNDSGTEIQVQFKQTEGLEYWTPVDKLGSSVHGLEKDSPIVSTDQGPLQISSSWTPPVTDRVPDDKTTGRRDKVSEPPGEIEIPLVQVNGVSKGSGSAFLSQGQDRIDSTVQGKGVEPNATSVAPAGGPKKSSVNIKDGAEKGKSIASEKRTIELEPKEPKPKPPRHLRLLNVTANINEKSAAFIENTRKKMSGSSSTEEKIS